MGESFDHCPAGWIRQRGKCCTQFIHNRMVVDFRPMSNVNFGGWPGQSLRGCPSNLLLVGRGFSLRITASLPRQDFPVSGLHVIWPVRDSYPLNVQALEVEADRSRNGAWCYIMCAAERRQKVVQRVVVPNVDEVHLRAPLVSVALEKIVITDGEIEEVAVRSTGRIVVVILGSR